jgi:2-keto-4-pentenoate hydratase/2-oxohepta-3-ene-1,7-dioic acid hydratase in catechol pathway
VVFEGELGIVIGKAARRSAKRRRWTRVRLHLRQRRHAGRHPAARRVVPAVGARQGLRHLLPARAGVATGLDPATLRVQTTLDGSVRQDYPISDMRFPVERLVSLISPT